MLHLNDSGEARCIGTRTPLTPLNTNALALFVQEVFVAEVLVQPAALSCLG
jgi:hypothetical protein